MISFHMNGSWVIDGAWNLCRILETEGSLTRLPSSTTCPLGKEDPALECSGDGCH